MIIGIILACLAAILCEFLRPRHFVNADLPYITWAEGALHAAGANAFSQNYQPKDPFALMSVLFDFSLWHQHPAGYLLTNFLLHGLVALFLALVVIELTGLSGNRAGAIGGIWAALLFSVAPNTACFLFSVAARPILFAALFLSAAGFFALRYRLLREEWYRYWSLACLALYICSLVGAISGLPVQSSSNIFPTPVLIKLEPENLLLNLLCAAYGVAFGIFTFRFSNNWLPKKSILWVACLTAPLVLASFCPDPYLPSLLVLCSVCLPVLLPLLALPLIDRASKKESLICGVIGTVVLSIIFLCFCFVFQEQSAALNCETALKRGGGRALVSDCTPEANAAQVHNKESKIMTQSSEF
jgi:hypothetical protein